MITALQDYRFSIAPEVAADHGGLKAVEVQLTVANEGTQQGKTRTWTPHLRRIIVNGAQRPQIPADFQKGGKHSLASASDVPWAATHAICEKFLEVEGYYPQY